MEARRTTLMNNGPLGNAFAPPSALPVPSSVMKKGPLRMGGGAGRYSMAPGAARQSTVNGGMGMSRTASQENLAGRRSTMVSRAGDGGGGGGGGLGASSANRGDGGMYGGRPSTASRVPPSTVRRSSVFAGRQSMAPGAMTMASAVKDNRPVRDKVFANACRDNVADFLNVYRSNLVLGPKTLTSPTGREFQDIFKFLIGFLVDGFVWGKSFEQDCWQLLRDLKYPSPDTCGKTALAAPGAPTHWPALLAMLNWFVDLCRAHDNWQAPDVVSDPLLMPASDLPLDHPFIEDRMFWDYASKTYTAWFDEAAEEFPDADAELDEFYERLTQSTFEESENLEARLQRLTVDLKSLQVQEPPLKVEQDEYLHLMSDKTKFIAFMDQLKQKHDKLQQGIVRSKAGGAEQERVLEQLRQELTETESKVAAQNLSPDEVTRMNHDNSSLDRQLKELHQKIAEAGQLASEQEVLVSNSMDRFNAGIATYNALGETIGTFPNVWNGPVQGPGGIDYAIDLDLGTDDMNEVQACGRRMREVLRPALNRYDEDIRGQTRALGEEQSRLDSEYDKLGLVVEQQKGDVENKELELSKRLEAAENAKSLHTQKSSDLQGTVKKLEDKVTHMSAQTQQGLIQDESNLEHTRMALAELKHKTALLQDNVVYQMTDHMDMIVKAKNHVANTLKGVRQLAETQ